MLTTEGLRAGYGLSEAIDGIDLEVSDGELVALLGRNGMGKSTLIRSLMGMVPPEVRKGSITYRGRELVGLAPHEIAQLGIALVPQGRRVFRSLTVVENLTVAARSRSEDGDGDGDLDRVFEMFPRLGERKTNNAEQLSGGEQQMLAIGRALMTNPALLIMDEPSEGLAPIIVEAVKEQLRLLKEQSLSVLLVEQNYTLALDLADRVYVLENGRVVFEGGPGELDADDEAKQRYLGVGV